ncbi:MAG: hypothetical protein ABUS79_29650, partial [Pseudomonadota bacterium]
MLSFTTTSASARRIPIQKSMVTAQVGRFRPAICGNLNTPPPKGPVKRQFRPRRYRQRINLVASQAGPTSRWIGLRANAG